MQKNKFIFLTLFFLLFSLFVVLFSQLFEIKYGGEIAMLFPKGIIALKERNLLFIIQILMFIVVIPVLSFTFYFAWKYRAGNTSAKYTPDWDNNVLLEYIWWGIPFILVVIIGTITWIRTHELDPFKPIESKNRPLTIQVVALQWKWLFIYPEQGVASLNFFQFPEKTPLNFEITADAPMNSFWIPQLGGQVFAMPKMKTLLHLIADEVGEYRGCSANISGTGFAGMHFIAKATTQENFEEWVTSLKDSDNKLDLASYQILAKPTENHPIATYKLEEEKLFETILMKFAMPMPPAQER